MNSLFFRKNFVWKYGFRLWFLNTSSKGFGSVLVRIFLKSFGSRTGSIRYGCNPLFGYDFAVLPKNYTDHSWQNNEFNYTTRCTITMKNVVSQINENKAVVLFVSPSLHRCGLWMSRAPDGVEHAAILCDRYYTVYETFVSSCHGKVVPSWCLK